MIVLNYLLGQEIGENELVISEIGSDYNKNFLIKMGKVRVDNSDRKVKVNNYLIVKVYRKIEHFKNNSKHIYSI